MINTILLDSSPAQRQAWAKKLLEAGIVKFQMDPLFTWTSGIKSPVYCDIRQVIGHPDLRREWVDQLVSTCPELQEAEWIAGTSTAGIPWASFVAERLNLPMVYVRSQAKGHGMGKRVEGYIAKGKKVVLVEDLLSTGGSAVSSLQALSEEADAQLLGVVSLNQHPIHVESEIPEAFAALPFYTLLRSDVILEQALEMDLLSAEDHAKIQAFWSDPWGWV